MLKSHLKPDPERKGSYLRRMNDNLEALAAVKVDSLHPGLQLVLYYAAAEKLSRAIVGIQKQHHNSNTVFTRRHRIELAAIQSASTTLGISPSSPDLAWIFADPSHDPPLPLGPKTASQSARSVRNLLTHDFGPSNLELLAREGKYLTPKLKAFVKCTREVERYLRANFSHLD